MKRLDRLPRSPRLRPRPRSRLSRRVAVRCAAALVTAALAPALSGCEPEEAGKALLGPSVPQRLGIASTSFGRAPVATDATLAVRFTAAVDERSVGTRSVRVYRAGGRRVTRLRVWSKAEAVFVAPAPGREFPAGEALTLVVEGGPSPRGLRSAAGEPLEARFEAAFRTGTRRGSDLIGPRLVATHPRSGAVDVPPGSSVELGFSEPLSRGSIRNGTAVSLWVEGRPAAARLGISEDLRGLVVRPEQPLPPGVEVRVEVHESLLDLCGNPLDRGGGRALSFRTRATTLHEIAEEFVSTEMLDPEGTNCGWGDVRTPGLLVARPGTLLSGAGALSDATLELADRRAIRFQVVLPGDDLRGGFASGLRLAVSAATEEVPVTSITVDAGSTFLDACHPTWDANRSAARLVRVADVGAPAALEPSEPGAGHVDVPFEQPLRIEPGAAVLLDVRAELAPGTRLGALPDTFPYRALVDGPTEPGHPMPAVYLLVAGCAPRARSGWYDTGIEAARWQRQYVVRDESSPESELLVEFQAARAGPDGLPDEGTASAWERDLGELRPDRFVRFRLRFHGWDVGEEPGWVDRLVMPYER